MLELLLIILEGWKCIEFWKPAVSAALIKKSHLFFGSYVESIIQNT